MKTDGLFDYRVVEVPFSKYNEPISLYPMSDIHRDSPNFAHGVWENTLDDIKRDKNQKLFILIGDTLEALSTTERRHIIDLHDTSKKTWGLEYAKRANDFIKEVSPIMKGKTLAVFGGNHYFEFANGTTTDQAIAGGLNAPYIGVCGYIVLILKYKGSPYSHAVKIFCHHGTSEARMKQARANFRADLVLMGHNHQMHATPLSDIDIVQHGHNWRIIQHETRLVRTGSFLKTYEAGMASYGADAGYAPAILGCPKITITPRRKDRKINNVCSTERWIDIKAVV